MTRPRGSPPMPSAMSSPSDPVDTVSVSSPRSRLPSFITEPLPKARSIWLSAASSARLRSLFSSLFTTRNCAACDMPDLLLARRPRRRNEGDCTCFVPDCKPLDKALIRHVNTLYRSGLVQGLRQAPDGVARAPAFPTQQERSGQ